MKIKIENLGPVEEACIDLGKRLTVFCGLNNTGKTYVSYLLYGLTKMVSHVDYGTRYSEYVPNFTPRVMHTSAVDIDLNHIFEVRERDIEQLHNQMRSIFGVSQFVSDDDLFKDLKVSYVDSPEVIKQKVDNAAFKFTLHLNDRVFEIEKAASSEKIQIDSNDNILDVYETMIMSYVDKELAYYPLTDSIFFPVERSSIYTFNKELSIKRNELIEQIQSLSNDSSVQDPFEFVNKRSTRYPLVVRDGLKLAEDLVNESKQVSPFHHFADEIEEQLLQGKMSVSAEGEMQFTSSKNNSRSLPIHMSASIVKTLASFIFYLRHQAKKNELVIIDEPEINLHPHSQVVLTRILARMVNQGFRLLISTHSDYIIRELNNLIMILHDSPSVQKMAEKLEYDIEKESICPEDVGAYRFYYASDDANRVSVDEIKVHKDGLEISAMDDVTVLQTNVGDKLSDALYYGDAD